MSAGTSRAEPRKGGAFGVHKLNWRRRLLCHLENLKSHCEALLFQPRSDTIGKTFSGSVESKLPWPGLAPRAVRPMQDNSSRDGTRPMRGEFASVCCNHLLNIGLQIICSV